MPPRRAPRAGERLLRRDSAYPDEFGGGEFGQRVRRRGVRLDFRWGLPRTLWGRIAAGTATLLILAAGLAALLFTRSLLLREEHFAIADFSSIQIEGNSHLSRPQLLSVFGTDVERNIFLMPLDERRAELERLPWVARATVMRLLPNRVRISIVERTPVAFVRQGSKIGLVDVHGVLLKMDADAPQQDGDAEPKPPVHYSFPVLTGISADDPISTRAARMKIYTGFLAALDSGGEKVSTRLSEVDLSNPEDVKAIIPDAASGRPVDILVHFGNDKYLDRYHAYLAHLAEWRTQYPKLASVDMRYERQVVLEMAPGSAVPVSGTDGPAAATPAPTIAAPVAKTPAKELVKAAAKPPAPPVKAPVVATAKAVAKPKPGATAKPQGVPR